jgi:hypothetical protein
MGPLLLLLIGIVCAGAGFLFGMWVAARMVGNRLAVALKKGMSEGWLTNEEAQAILDDMDEA